MSIKADQRMRDRVNAADALAQAERTRVPVPLLSVSYPYFDVTDAYEVQLINARNRVAAGATIRGHKVGLTNNVVRRQAGLSEPDYGHLFDDMFLHDGDSVATSQFCTMLGVEIELAFVLERPLKGPSVSVADVLRATAFIIPAIEIVDSRYIRNGPNKFSIIDTIADNAGCARIVVGGHATNVIGLDLRTIGGVLRRNGTIVDTGATASVLGNPAISVAWLVNKVAEFDIGFEPGHVILSGSCVKILRGIHAGDVITADFDQLGHVAIRFT
jgi:2-oxo-hept-3-ene-1,7-dioate hydratase